MWQKGDCCQGALRQFLRVVPLGKEPVWLDGFLEATGSVPEGLVVLACRELSSHFLLAPVPFPLSQPSGIPRVCPGAPWLLAPIPVGAQGLSLIHI